MRREHESVVYGSIDLFGLLSTIEELVVLISLV